MEDKDKSHTKKEYKEVKTGKEKDNIKINIKIFNEGKEEDKIIQQFNNINKELPIEEIEESEEKQDKDKKNLNALVIKKNIYGSYTVVNERSPRDFSSYSSSSFISNIGIISSLEGNSFKQNRSKSEGKRVFNIYSESKFIFFLIINFYYF